MGIDLGSSQAYLPKDKPTSTQPRSSLFPVRLLGQIIGV